MSVERPRPRLLPHPARSSIPILPTIQFWIQVPVTTNAQMLDRTLDLGFLEFVQPWLVFPGDGLVSRDRT